MISEKPSEKLQTLPLLTCLRHLIFLEISHLSTDFSIPLVYLAVGFACIWHIAHPLLKLTAPQYAQVYLRVLSLTHFSLFFSYHQSQCHESNDLSNTNNFQLCIFLVPYLLNIRIIWPERIPLDPKPNFVQKSSVLYCPWFLIPLTFISFTSCDVTCMHHHRVTPLRNSWCCFWCCRLERLDHLAKKFRHKCDLHDQWCGGKEEALKTHNFNKCRLDEIKASLSFQENLYKVY